MSYYKEFETIFTEEEEKLLEMYTEDEDYTILNADIIEKLMKKDEDYKAEEYNRACTFNFNMSVIINWIYSWFR